MKKLTKKQKLTRKANIPVWLVYSIMVLVISMLLYLIIIGKIDLLGLGDKVIDSTNQMPVTPNG